jgi:hypothetical protein
MLILPIGGHGYLGYLAMMSAKFRKVTTSLILHGIEPSSRLQEIGKLIENEIKLHGLIGFGRVTPVSMSPSFPWFCLFFFFFFPTNVLCNIVPKACPDADDTAMTLIALKLQGKPYSLQAMVDHFERDHHFATYPFETHTSVSANANVLSALVLLSTDSRYQPQIEKCTRYLCEAWFHCDRMVKDKWVCRKTFMMENNL